MRRKRIPDNKRFSIIHDMESCYFCGGRPVDIHECFHGTANRRKSIENGLCIALCRMHHDAAHHDRAFDKVVKMIGKRAFLENHTEEEFIKIFGRSYEGD